MLFHTLSESDQNHAAFYAWRTRKERDDRKSGKSLESGNEDYYETDQTGFGGEIAFCRMFGLKPTIISNVAKWRREDAKTKDGRTIDVKTATILYRPDGSEIIKKYGYVEYYKADNGKRCDIYAFMSGEFPTFGLDGFAIADDVFRPENKTINPGNGKPRWSMPKDLMRHAGDKEIRLSIRPPDEWKSDAELRDQKYMKMADQLRAVISGMVGSAQLPPQFDQLVSILDDINRIR